jgi:hypothetical protein
VAKRTIGCGEFKAKSGPLCDKSYDYHDQLTWILLTFGKE